MCQESRDYKSAGPGMHDPALAPFFPVKMIRNFRIRYLRPLCCPFISLIFTPLSDKQARESRSLKVAQQRDIRNYHRESRDRETRIGRTKRHPSTYPNPILFSFIFVFPFSPFFSQPLPPPSHAPSPPHPPPAREGPSRDLGSTCINIIRSSHGYGSRRIIKSGRIGQKEGAEPVSFISLPRFVGVLSLPKKTKQPVLNFLFGFVPRTFLYRPAQQGV